MISADLNLFRQFSQSRAVSRAVSFVVAFIFLLGVPAASNLRLLAQSSISGSFVGTVRDSAGKGISGVTIIFTNKETGVQTIARTDENGQFSKTSLPSAEYEIKAEAADYESKTTTQSLFTTQSNSVVPVPFVLEKAKTAAITDNAKPSAATDAANNTPKDDSDSGGDEIADLNPRRGGLFNVNQVRDLPLGSATLTRTFDELALLIPGVAPPPQAIGGTVGPGVGGGVGTSGQFSVNGLRSRANNFTVDGSDNNDEDIGVRRQGFFALVPQPIESIREFSIITLLAPAEFGRNLGAQVNAVSLSGGNRFSGTIFGLLNGDFLNARNFFDNADGNTTTGLQGRRLNDGALIPVFVDNRQANVTNSAGEKDASSLLQGGFAVGGPIVGNKLFFFASGEGERLDGTKETNFSVPTVEQRGLFGTGAQGLFLNNFPTAGQTTPLYPSAFDADVAYSLFPFPNNPTGIYGRNTYTQALPIDAAGRILSGKIDWNIFKINNNQQILTARYNYTDDKRNLTDVGGALFSAIRPLVTTNNFSSYLSGSLTDSVSNEFRFSWGRTELEFEELRDSFLSPVGANRFSNPRDARFILNAPLLVNNTIARCSNQQVSCSPSQVNYANRVDYLSSGSTTANQLLGPIGQLIIAGFSPVGVDVFNFPQERKNDTFQFADTMRLSVGQNAFSFGTDIRRTFLESDLPRNSRPLVTFYGGNCTLAASCPGGFGQPLDFVATGAPSGFFQSLVLPGEDSRINLSYYQLNFFAQDEWRVNPRLLLSFGLRYEYNTPPKEADDKIESTFSQTLPPRVADLAKFIDGRTQIFDSDTNNFAPRFGIAAGLSSNTVIRGGFGLYYDQILGAVVSQSRNVFPTFTTINFGGGAPNCFNSAGTPVNCGSSTEAQRLLFFNFFNPLFTSVGGVSIIQPGTLNTLNPVFVSGSSPTNNFLNTIYFNFPFGAGTPFGATLPERSLDMPYSGQYSIGVEQRLFNNNFLSVAYVGTYGRNLLRFTTPNLGSNYVNTITGFFGDSSILEPFLGGTTRDPNRPVSGIGPIQQFETTGRSRYDSLQIELRGRLTQKFQYRAGYVYGKVKDDVSDVFDLAGAFALPQNSVTFEGEYAPANFDVRHRFTYNFIYDAPEMKNRNGVVKFLLGGWQIAGTGKFNTGQPFTVNSVFDVNQDGNLTDRLNNRQFIAETGEGRQPLTLTSGANLTQMLAGFGRDGAIPRNSFRAGNLLELDLSFAKRFAFRETQSFQFRVDVLNFINRANFNIPVRFLEAPGFGQATDTVTPGRRIQFVLRYNF